MEIDWGAAHSPRGDRPREIPVKDAADMFGFPSAQHFSRTFRNFVGVTPAKWHQRGKSA